MNKIEEIRNLKSLLDKAEISESEFQVRKQKIMAEPIEEISKDETKLHQDHLIIYTANIREAGRYIKKSVTSHVLYVSCFTFSVVIYMFASISAIGEILSGRSVSSALSNSPSFILSIMLMMAGGIFWIVSLVRMTKAGDLLLTSSPAVSNTHNSAETVMSPIEPEVVSHIAPEIISQNKSVKSSVVKGKREVIMVEFADGLKGRIDYQVDENRYFFRQKRTDVIYDFLVCYDTEDHCANALHYYLTTGKTLKAGYLGSFT